MEWTEMYDELENMWRKLSGFESKAKSQCRGRLEAKLLIAKVKVKDALDSISEHVISEMKQEVIDLKKLIK